MGVVWKWGVIYDNLKLGRGWLLTLGREWQIQIVSPEHILARTCKGKPRDDNRNHCPFSHPIEHFLDCDRAHRGREMQRRKPGKDAQHYRLANSSHIAHQSQSLRSTFQKTSALLCREFMSGSGEPRRTHTRQKAYVALAGRVFGPAAVN